ncbi:MAG TPA: hypothetical protein PKH43_06435 [Saprospiraceae bacterium]|nr:hypothetical protein [Saprospiraceae bacterium]
MPTRTLIVIAMFALALVACRKDDPVPVQPEESFTLYFDNEFNSLQARYGAFISDADGRVRAFRWLEGLDTASLSVSRTASGDRFDCTIVKITNIDASGSGVVDTTISLTTYTNISSGQNIRLSDQEFRQSIDLLIQFTNINSLDSIIVPDGLTFARPQLANNYTGQYRILHTGKIWLRILINGESTWRYMFFDNVAGPTQAASIDATILPKLLNAPSKYIGLPYNGPWKYEIEGLVDTSTLKFMPLGDLLRAPGGAIPIFDQLAVFEPEVKPYSGYRVRMSAPIGSAGYGYVSDGYYASLPSFLSEPPFDIQAAVPANTRYAAARCNGDMDLVSFTRTHAGLPGIKWEALIAADPGGIVSYRLPDLPDAVAALSFSLRTYNFGNSMETRAESYANLSDPARIMQYYMAGNDPRWQTKGKYVARIRNF